MLKHLLIGAAALGAAFGGSVSAKAQTSDPYLGDVMVVGYNFCPRGWGSAEGQLLSIASNQALFALIGTVYGGDGRTTFALPDLRGRVPIHYGQGPGQPFHQVGSRFGTETVTLNITQLAPHRHAVRSAGANSANQPSPENHSFAAFPASQPRYAADANPTKAMDSDLVLHTGNNAPFDNMAPTLVMRYCVAMEGLFPPRD